MSQVTIKKEGALATNIFEADADQGTQNMLSKDDQVLPFLKILGQLSPEVNKRDAKYVEGAEPGKIINTVTNKLYNKIDVIPVFYHRHYIEWKDRGTTGGGAPVGSHAVDSPVLKTVVRGKDYKDRLPNGNYLDNTANHYVSYLNDVPQQALISMKSTQLKISRKWNSVMLGLKMRGKNGLFTPPTYSHIYTLKTVQMSNDKGTWFGWDVEKKGPVTDKNLYEMAKKMSQSARDGALETKPEGQESKSNSPY